MATITIAEVAQDPEFLALPSGERLKVLRKVATVDDEFKQLASEEQEKVFRHLSGQPEQRSSQGLGQYGLGLIESVPQTAIGLGREAVRFGQDIASFPSRWAQAGQIDWRDLLRHPGPIGTAAVETGRELVQPLVQAAPEITGGTLGGLLGGPWGVPLGAGMAREAMGIAQNIPARERAQQTGAAFLTTAAGQRAPQLAEAIRKAPGRYLSLPAERHAAGAAMMEKIPERFGVNQDIVTEGYARAERYSKLQSAATTGLENFRSDTKALAQSLRENPIAELQDAAFIKRLDTIASQADELATAGGASAKGVDRIIKAVNKEIGETKGETRAVWKQVLRSVHDDMRAAAERTGDPAFSAYSDAIQKARLNFLRDEIQEVINTSGIKQQRTGTSVLTNPGAVKQWMQKHPDWVTKVEKAQPGIIDSIRQDLAEIQPITDVVGRSVPGQRFGSGRLVLGGAVGHLANRFLGLPPGALESAGILVGGLSPQAGLQLSPNYIRTSFAPGRVPPSKMGASLGVLTSPFLGAVAGETE